MSAKQPLAVAQLHRPSCTHIQMLMHAGSMVLLSLAVLVCLYSPSQHVTPQQMGIYGST